jgi:minor extracellular serine protease Vpr
MGLGAVGNQPADGAASPSNPLAHTTTLAQVSIGGVQTAASFSGLAPGFVGLYQVNVLVPASVAAGSAVPVAVSIGGATSNTVTIAVGP